MKFRCGDKTLSLERVAVMGVLNVTPDSFSDGGMWLDPDAAMRHGIDMVAEGAALIDVGGESTRPGAHPVAEDEELARVIPVIERLVREVDVPISIDTRKPAVARRALEAGSCIVNETSGESRVPEIGPLVAGTGAGIVVMHSRGTPQTMKSLTDYDDVVADVRRFLQTAAEELELDGVPRDSIVLDPGFGFAKTPAQNLELLRRLSEIVDIGYPVLSGTSRKSFIGAVLDLPEDQRVEGTAATVTWAVAQGARMVRVHDVAAIVRTVRMSEAILHGADL